jgi:SAM-dependent methyltransferase
MTPRQFLNAVTSRLSRYAAAAGERIGSFRQFLLGHPKEDATAIEIQNLKNEIQSLKNELTTQSSFMNHDLVTEIGGMFEVLNKSLTSTELQVAGLNERQQAGLNERQQAGLNELQSARLNELQALLSERSNQILGRLNEIDNRVFEGINKILGAHGAAENRIIEVSNRSFELSNALQHLSSDTASRLNEVVNHHFPSVLEQVHESAAFQLPSRVRENRSAQKEASRPTPITLTSMDDVLKRASQDFSAVYKEWFERYETLVDAMSQTKVGNAAHGGDTYSRLFKAFLERYAHGPLLDVGCGPFGCPYYLKDYPAHLVVGLDPMPNEHYEDNVSLIRGISEYLPFDDGAFGTVVSGTSLDHCLSLDRSLDEMTRVTAENGIILLWLGSVPGSPRFDPLASDYQPADQFHLFHFDVAWFEPMLEERFEILERVKLEKGGYAHVFYALKKQTEVEAEHRSIKSTDATVTDPRSRKKVETRKHSDGKHR